MHALHFLFSFKSGDRVASRILFILKLFYNFLYLFSGAIGPDRPLVRVLLPIRSGISVHVLYFYRLYRSTYYPGNPEVYVLLKSLSVSISCQV